MSWFTRLIGRSTATVAVSGQKAALESSADLARILEQWGGSGGRSTKSGQVITPTTALEVTTILAGGRVIGEGLAMLPLHVHQRVGNQTTIAADHPVNVLLSQQPNDWQTPFEFMETLTMHAVLDQGGFGLLVRRPSDGRVIEILPLIPEWVKVRRKADWSVDFLVTASPAIEPAGAQMRFVVPFGDMLYLRGPSWNGVRGLRSIELAREAIGLARSTEAQHARLHKNSVQPSGVYSVEGSLTEAQYKQLSAWIQQYQGSDATGEPFILTNGMKWASQALSGVDAEHLATRAFQIEEICRALRVFPQMIGHSDKTATFASAESFFQASVIYTFMPWARRWEQVISRDLLTVRDRAEGYYPKIALQGMMRGDAKARSIFYQGGIQNGWMTRNEAREFEDMNPIDGLDEPLTPQNMAVGAIPDDPPAKPAAAGA